MKWNEDDMKWYDDMKKLLKKIVSEHSKHKKEQQSFMTLSCGK